MLIKCPECELQVSDKALSCPHCGYPMSSKAPVKRKKPNKRRRLPNGFGQISEIKNRNLRKPFRAMITVGKTDEGRPICKPLKPVSYFETYNEAYEALIVHGRNPYYMDQNITLKELYERWKPTYFETITDSAKRNINAAWKYCEPLYNYQITSLTAGQLRDMINTATRVDGQNIKQASATTKLNMKSLLNRVFDYGLEHGIIDKNIAKNFRLDKGIKKEASTVTNRHMSFTEKEMELLWDNLYKVKDVDIILIQCYTGFRPQELGALELENINLKDGAIIGGMKTEAGTNRLVPIHSKIFKLVEKRYNESLERGCKYLLTCSDKNPNEMMSYHKYAYRFSNMIKELGINPDHKPHDGRKHFITMAKKYDMDDFAIKRIVGHVITDITEKVYTERDIAWLSGEIEKIK